MVDTIYNRAWEGSLPARSRHTPSTLKLPIHHHMSLGLADRALLYATFISTSAVSFISTYPFGATLVKYRANYAPKRVELLEHEGHQGRSVSEVNSYFAMLKRVKKFEVRRMLIVHFAFLPMRNLQGMAGHYKGISKLQNA